MGAKGHGWAGEVGSWQLTCPPMSEWRAANGGGGGPEPSRVRGCSGLPHGSWNWCPWVAAVTVVAEFSGNGGGLRQGVGNGGVLGGWVDPALGTLAGQRACSQQFRPGAGVGGWLWALRRGSRILQRTTLNLWAWTLRPFSGGAVFVQGGVGGWRTLTPSSCFTVTVLIMPGDIHPA